MKKWMVKMAGLFNPMVKEIVELLYQWDQDYIFACSKFNEKFPDFKTTSIEDGIAQIIDEWKQ